MLGRLEATGSSGLLMASIAVALYDGKIPGAGGSTSRLTHCHTTTCCACRQEVPVLLAALLTLRRVAIHHPQLLGDSLEDVSQASRTQPDSSVCTHAQTPASRQRPLTCSTLYSFHVAHVNRCCWSACTAVTRQFRRQPAWRCWT